MRSDVQLRPMRAGDRERVLELTSDVWGGGDYMDEVFDDWVSDPSGWFQAAEVDGFLVGVQRMRPLNRSIVWYEGLRVASTHRHQGIASAMVRSAEAEAAQLGFNEMRLASGGASPLFVALGFQLRLAVGSWAATRMEGGEPARMPPATEASRLFEITRRDPAFAAYNGINPDLGASRDLDLPELESLLERGSVRVTASGRALALVRPSSGGTRLRATFLSGSGAALEELLSALRFEADADGRVGAALLVPDLHPGLPALAGAGFERQRWESGDPVHFRIFSKRLLA